MREITHIRLIGPRASGKTTRGNDLRRLYEDRGLPALVLDLEGNTPEAYRKDMRERFIEETTGNVVIIETETII